MKRIIFSSIALLSAITIMAQTQVTDTDLNGAYKSRAYSKRVVCHDPSIVIDDISSSSNPIYYIYGSHLGRGKTAETSNYQEWTTFRAGEESTGNTNSLFANAEGTLVNYSLAYRSHLVKEVKNSKGETVKFGNFNANGWQYTGNTVKGMQWAPDIIYNKKMKKWCMYMSLNGDHWCSSIVCFISDNIEGPWKYQGPVVFSGFQGTYAHNSYAAADDWKQTDFAIATGETTLPARYKVGDKWGTYWPNCIDPCVFYDDNDNLWMSYGSWSGGIFMLKLNEDNGLRDYQHTYGYEVNGQTATPGSANANCTSDPYFGKKIAGGYYVSGEASYIEKIGNHYFLFMSYGGLTSDGGYQMRIFRADKPDGPYKDCYGTSAIFDRYLLNYGNTANDNRGVLLFGGYQWDTMPTAEIAQGHNSAFTDKQGRSFVVYHTRFNNGTEGHQVRVHQLFLNDEGWLMAAPFEFDGETVTNSDIAAKSSVTDSEIPGNYQFLRHQYNQNVANKEYEKPVNIYLAANGTVSGGATGTWKRTSGTDYITLTISNVEYRGVLVRQTLDYTDIPAISIVALSSSSGSLTIGKNTFTRQQEVWAVKADPKAAIKYTLDKMQMPLTNNATINSNVTLPTTGLLGANVSWKSSNPAVMTDNGVILDNGNITMTVSISNDKYVYNKTYEIHVDKSAQPTVPVYYPVSTLKNTTSIWWTNFSTQDYTLEKGKSMQFKFYNYSNELKNWNNWCLYGANVTHGAAGYAEYFGIRNDNWDNTSSSSTGCTSNFIWSTFKSDMNGSMVDMTVNYSDAGVFNMTAVITNKDNKEYNYSYTKTIATKPGKITLFFVNEGSYIDGSTISGIENTVTDGQTPSHRTNAVYNISGQRVDDCYRGIVIINGKKYVRK